MCCCRSRTAASVVRARRIIRPLVTSSARVSLCLAREQRTLAHAQASAANFGRIRNPSIGGKAGIKGAQGDEIVSDGLLEEESSLTPVQRQYGAFFGQSAFAKHALVVENSVVKVPKGTDLVALAPLGCGMQTGAGAVLNLLKPSESSVVLITGAGAVGLGALFAAAYLKVKTIIVVDIVPSRLELAKSLGATHAINGLDEDVVAQVSELGASFNLQLFILHASNRSRLSLNTTLELRTLLKLLETSRSCAMPTSLSPTEVTCAVAALLVQATPSRSIFSRTSWLARLTQGCPRATQIRPR